MLLDEFLTGYDESLGGELNVDPLGLLVIWSAFGQRIFQSRISSIANDVRSYTLNLFNHRLIRQLIDDDSVVLGSGLKKTYGSKNDLNFKHACLVYLENLYVYSIIAHQHLPEVQSSGVPGISKASERWNASGKNPQLLFSHREAAQVLVRQTMLGVSGRYKTPLVEMGFFDRHYHYGSPQAMPLWAKADELFGKANSEFLRLHGSLYKHLRELLASHRAEPVFEFRSLPKKLAADIVKAFGSSSAVGAKAGDFWLAVTGLDQGAAGALHRVLLPPKGSNVLNDAPAAEVFAQAVGQDGLDSDAQARLDQVCRLEPFLSELDLLFTLMLADTEQPLTRVGERWRERGRDAHTLAKCAARVEGDVTMLTWLSSTGRQRLTQLLQLVRHDSLEAQINGLLQYHAQIMESRGQSPWLTLRDGKHLKAHVRPRYLPTPEERPPGSWVHHYYVPQFRYWLSGILGDDE